jgi:hypothetical protein
MERHAGEAFHHYLRKDKSGARPIPKHLLDEWLRVGWLKRPELPSVSGMKAVPCVVLDPFSGSGTTVGVAVSLGRRGIGIDISPDYTKQAAARMAEYSRGSLFQRCGP